MKIPKKLIVFTEEVLNNEEKRIIERALDKYIAEGEVYLKGSIPKRWIEGESKKIKELQTKIWKL